ncbi:MAG TPA: hypothetical protein VLE72_01705 [Candidatus Saccharimonadales bacterium]|nr:hypothetical protein [Candidatus Saccharimonadales bacterium]
MTDSLVLTNKGNLWIVDSTKELFDPSRLPKTRISGEDDLRVLVRSEALSSEGDKLVFGAEMGLWEQVTICFDVDKPSRLAFEVDDAIDSEVVRSAYRQALMNISLSLAFNSDEPWQVEFRDTPAAAELPA